MKRTWLLYLFLPLAALTPLATAELSIFGWIERVQILDGALILKAKFDTGAATSSLDATEIQIFRRAERRWVRFTVRATNDGEPLVLERPVLRTVRIVRHDGAHQRRAVISLDVCFGNHHREVEFTLIDRREFIYPVLLGRSALEGAALVDPGATFLSKPQCFSPDRKASEPPVHP